MITVVLNEHGLSPAELREWKDGVISALGSYGKLLKKRDCEVYVVRANVFAEAEVWKRLQPPDSGFWESFPNAVIKKDW